MQKNYFWIDFLKAVAAFAVILLHICVLPLNDFSDQQNWQIANIYDSAVRFCVPVFVMISGVLLLGKTEPLSIFLRKRFSRLLWPFFLWSAVYLVLKIDYSQTPSQILLFSAKLLKVSTEYHLWYIYMLIGLYLFTPILRQWTTSAGKNEVVYFLVIWLVTILLSLPLINKFYTRIDLSYFTGYIGYFVLGFFLQKFIKREHRILGGLLYIVAVFFTIIITKKLSAEQNQFDGTYYKYLTINVVLMSVGVFLMSRNLQPSGKKMPQLISIVSKYSYGIYLSHVFILIIFGKIGFTYHLFPAWFSIPLIAICCLLSSLLLTFLISKIPFIGKYISG